MQTRMCPQPPPPLAPSPHFRRLNSSSEFTENADANTATQRGFLNQHGLFRHSHVTVVVVLCAQIAEQRPVSAAIFRAGVRNQVPTLGLRECSALRQSLKQMLTDVVHSIGLFRVGQLVNPDRLGHLIPPASVSTVAHARMHKHLPKGPDVLRCQPTLGNPSYLDSARG